MDKRIDCKRNQANECGGMAYLAERQLRRGRGWPRVALLAVLLTGLALTMRAALGEPAVGEPLPPWEPGMLDIHQINIGTGDAALFIFPDGTAMLLDAGATVRDRPPHYDAPPLPSDSRPPAEWVARYIWDVHPSGDEVVLDYAVVTHFHGDHMGTVTDNSPLSASGAYRLSGITGVGDAIPIHTVIDRGWPAYDFPASLDNRMMSNYRDFLAWGIEQGGMEVERFEAGRNDQITLRHAPEDYPAFEVRNIAVNGEVWTGEDLNVRNRFPRDDPPSENNCSLAFRLRYGPFAYFNGGDLNGVIPDDAPAWRDMESAVAWVTGPVDVHALNHHGFRDAANAFFLSVLQPRIHILAVYAASHPGPDVMRRMMSEEIYPGERGIFMTNGMWEGRKPNMADLFGEEEADWLERRINEADASEGHIVVRVEPGGGQYRVIVLDDATEERAVRSVHGPYTSRGGTGAP